MASAKPPYRVSVIIPALNEDEYIADCLTSILASAYGTEAVATRMREISSSGFELRLQEQESSEQQHVFETVAYLAWEPSSGEWNGTIDSAVTVDGDPAGKGRWPRCGRLPFFVRSAAVVFRPQRANVLWNEAMA